MVPVLFLFCVPLWFILRGASCLVVTCSLISSFSVLWASWSSRLGKRELIYVLLLYMFADFAPFEFVSFSFPIGVRRWLRLMIVVFSITVFTWHTWLYLNYCWDKSKLPISYKPFHKGHSVPPLEKTTDWGLRYMRKTGFSESGPSQANLVLIAYASSEGSGEPAHPRSLARTSAARSYEQWVKRNLQIESQIPGPSEWLGMRS